MSNYKKGPHGCVEAECRLDGPIAHVSVVKEVRDTQDSSITSLQCKRCVMQARAWCISHLRYKDYIRSTSQVWEKVNKVSLGSRVPFWMSSWHTQDSFSNGTQNWFKHWYEGLDWLTLVDFPDAYIRWSECKLRMRDGILMWSFDHFQTRHLDILWTAFHRLWLRNSSSTTTRCYRTAVAAPK